MEKIRLTNGKTIKATIVDKIDSIGNQYSIATTSRGVMYIVASRDFDGAIWRKI